MTEEEFDELEEAIKRKVVIRGGKRIRKKVLSPSDKKAGFKVQGGKKVKMSAGERLRRKKAAKKGARKSKGKRGMATKKRLRSLKKRTGLK